jgi:vacuolar-type H+-ATPase subunit F/Vma7
MSIEAEEMKAFYYEDEDDKKSIEETQDQIDNDFNIVLITQQINTNYKNSLSRNAKVIKVLYQVTNQLNYIITY